MHDLIKNISLETIELLHVTCIGRGQRTTMEFGFERAVLEKRITLSFVQSAVPKEAPG